MTQTFFPHPEHDDHDDETEALEPAHDDSLADGGMGGGEDITVRARVPKRRLAILTLGGLGMFVIAVMCFSPIKKHTQPSGALDAAHQHATMNGRLDQSKRAGGPPHGVADSLDPLTTDGGTAYAPGAAPPPAEDFLDPDHLRPAAGSANETPGGVASATSLNSQGNTSPGGSPGTPINTADPNGISPHGTSPTGSSYPGTGSVASAMAGTAVPMGTALRSDTVAVNNTGYSNTEMARQHALDVSREREKQETAQRDAATKRRRAEEQRLKSEGTLLASANIGSRTSASGGVLGGPASSDSLTATRFGAMTGKVAGGVAALPASGAKYDILPGTQVTAVLTTTYVSDAQGTGAIAARLTTPLTLRDGTVLLPIGTRALGTATASSPGAGRPATVSITLNTFITPDKTIIRTGLVGQGADPQTLALAVPAKTDNRFLGRILRGVASTAVDVLLASPTRDQAQSVFAAPTPYDLALERGGQRASDLINGPIGNENSVRAAVELDQDTEITVIFGLAQ